MSALGRSFREHAKRLDQSKSCKIQVYVGDKLVWVTSYAAANVKAAIKNCQQQASIRGE